jgi:hypothetical protein
MLVELLRPGGVELARRWVAALLLVPEGEREGVVAEVERRIVEVYDGRGATSGAADREIVVRYPAVQREGYVEEVVKRYEVRPGNGAASDEGNGAEHRLAGGA